MKKFNLNPKKNNSPIIIAEFSSNHNQSLETAISMLENSKKIGLKYIKLQTYKPETITLNSKRKEFNIKKNHKYWGGENLYNLYEKAYTPWEWHKTIFEVSKKLDLFCFSSPFDETAVDFLEKLNTPAYKIASFEITHIPLIKKIGKTRKPVILSTGMATKEEIHEAIETLKISGCKEYSILKCTSNYPANPKDSNLLTIPDMIREFNCKVGLSDHTPGIGTSITAIGLGATLIEKHVTPCKTNNAVDSKFSLDFGEFRQLIIESKRAWQSIGKVKYGPSNRELDSLRFRRSIYLTRNVKKGDRISPKHIKIIRPSLGEHPRYYNYLIGKRVKKNLKKNTPIKREYVK